MPFISTSIHYNNGRPKQYKNIKEKLCNITEKKINGHSQKINYEGSPKEFSKSLLELNIN